MDESTQIEKMREAMQIIVEVRDSERLRQFFETGRDRMYFFYYEESFR